MAVKNEVAVFAAGCFWHVEDIFSKSKGVIKTRVGYTGGSKKNPTYEEVSSGKTGHAEAVEVTYNPDIISYDGLLDVFWMLHDPTSLNKQGLDVGTNYRSAIFYLNESQKKSVLKSRNERQKAYKKPIVTEIVKSSKFYPAEDYHQKYYDKHKGMRLCQI